MTVTPQVYRWRDRPGEVLAVQINPGDREAMLSVIDWCGGRTSACSATMLILDTAEGPVSGHPYDWVVKTVDAFVVCDPLLFDAMFEAVSATGIG